MSEGHYSSLNLGLSTEDEESAVLENRMRLLRSIGGDPTRASMCRQVHGSTITRADAAGIHEPRGHPESDGLWTDRVGEAVVVLSADCLPIALCRLGEHPAVAAVHAGWRGIVGGVIEAAVDTLGSGDIVGVIGPGIGRCCYETGTDIALQFSERFGQDVVTSGNRLDLALCARRALEHAAVQIVDTVERCTSCEDRMFFSHRRDNGVTGRQGLVALIEDVSAA